MEFKGTQGEWRVENISGSDSRFYREGYVYAVETDAEYIACIENDSIENARLIAAAPDLLSVLMEIVETDDAAIAELKSLMGQHMESSDLTARARAAIAKALGESS